MSGDQDESFEHLLTTAGEGSLLRTEFHWQLVNLELRLIEAAEDVGGLITPATTAFLAGDPEDVEHRRVADAVIAACRGLEADGYLVLARQSPVAADLRRVVTVVRAAGDVQRSARLVRHVLAAVRWVDPVALAPPLRAVVGDLAEVASDVHAGAVTAWRRRDGLAAVELQRLDDRADELQRRLHAGLREHAGTVDEAVSLALVGRYLERLADHAVEIARGVTYAVTGERIIEEE